MSRVPPSAAGSSPSGASQREGAAERAIQQAESSLESLRVAYEQYFAAVIRRPPLEQEVQVARLIEKTRMETKAPSLRFRMDALHQRYQSYKRMWARTVREREEGTYRRDVFKAKLRSKDRSEAEAAPARSGGAPRARQERRLPSEEELRELYRTYLDARRQLGESAVGVSFERLAATVRQQANAIMDKHDVRAVELRVQVRDGKAVLQAGPRRDPSDT